MHRSADKKQPGWRTDLQILAAVLNGTYQFLDLLPKGRDEDPTATQNWVRYRDRS